jgi:hypothetical protein
VTRPVTCAACGERWEVWPPLTIACPDCRAPAGRRCRRPSGHDAPDLHTAREQAAMDAGILRRCPALPPRAADAVPLQASLF